MQHVYVCVCVRGGREGTQWAIHELTICMLMKPKRNYICHNCWVCDQCRTANQSNMQRMPALGETWSNLEFRQAERIRAE